MVETVMLGMWKNGKFIHVKTPIPDKPRMNCYGHWLKDIIEHRKKTGQY